AAPSLIACGSAGVLPYIVWCSARSSGQGSREALEEAVHDTGGGFDVGDGNGLSRVVADAALTAHEEHGGRDALRDVDRVMAGTTGQLDGAVSLGGDGVGERRAKARIHLGGQIATGWTPPLGRAALLADGLSAGPDSSNDIDACGVRGVAHLAGQPDLA